MRFLAVTASYVTREFEILSGGGSKLREKSSFHPSTITQSRRRRLYGDVLTFLRPILIMLGAIAVVSLLIIGLMSLLLLLD
jgi:hypothetical protein